MPCYLLTGGRQRPAHLLTREEWHAYEKAVLVELDSDTGQVRSLLEYASPPEHCPVGSPSFVFKAASWDGARLLLCTQTEVLFYDPRAAKITRTLSHPWFNDLHHVARIGGRLHVVSTGLDAVLVFDADDTEVEEVLSATGADPWARFDRRTDYRRVATTKPHQSHPNFVFEADGRRWLTRFEQRDVQSLDGEPLTVPLARDPVHDGVVAHGLAWFTVVSGEVVAVDLGKGKLRHRYALGPIEDAGDRPLGWCRGILHEGPLTLLAFSRLRPTTLKQNLAWLRAPLGKAPEPLPSRVIAADLATGRRIWSVEVEGAGISSIFSILPAAPPGPS